ncbi:protein FRA10AC1 homolog isoform X3 [Hyalella azteca]|uniref:Protein FRA10AC1 homolog isoform X3 n=1 Tax=Hyalella azteca TaxID=294128 RepID=A0A8B7N3S8_HYAAZ|nr:protein FRA10AC1 homolog isoform X3 [Hyalella azteca]
MSDDYDSSFEGDSFRPPGCRAKGLKIPSHKDPLLRTRSGPSHGSGLPSRADMNDLSCQSLGQILRYHQSSLTAYDRHKILVNQYLLYHPGATTQLQRDSSRDVRDMDVVRAHHQFLWEAGDDTSSWQKALAKKYFDKLFKEYCICDLSRYKENKQTTPRGAKQTWLTQAQLTQSQLTLLTLRQLRRATGRSPWCCLTTAAAMSSSRNTWTTCCCDLPSAWELSAAMPGRPAAVTCRLPGTSPSLCLDDLLL